MSAITFYLRLASGYDFSACLVLADVIRSLKHKKLPSPVSRSSEIFS